MINFFRLFFSLWCFENEKAGPYPREDSLPLTIPWGTAPPVVAKPRNRLPRRPPISPLMEVSHFQGSDERSLPVRGRSGHLRRRGYLFPPPSETFLVAKPEAQTWILFSLFWSVSGEETVEMAGPSAGNRNASLALFFSFPFSPPTQFLLTP